MDIAGLRQRSVSAYGRLPLSLRRLASATMHGETRFQTGTTRALQRARQRLRPIPGSGDVVMGGALRPHRATVVDHFDAWQHVGGLRVWVLEVLSSAGIRSTVLPHRRDAGIVIVPEHAWAAAWTALSRSPDAQQFWVRSSGQRSTPIGRVSEPPKAEVCEVFQYLASPDGVDLHTSEIYTRVERWSVVKESGLARPDGGTHEAGTLIAPIRGNSYAAYLSPQVQADLSTEREWPPPTDEVVGPVDIVYTWVDGSEDAWLEKRERYAGGGDRTSDALIAARYENRDELRYSLRSVEMYAGWVNRIYLVTDDQVPTWLARDHPRITVVDHRDIFDSESLPVFNSHAIESRLHHIPGLSELFLYLNDDVFFGRPVTPEHFFTGAGLTKFFPSKALLDPARPSTSDVSVSSAAKNNRDLLERLVGRTFTTKLKHTPHAHSRSLLLEMEGRFPEVFRANVSARFRTHADHAILSGLAQRYGHATGRSVPGDLVYNYVDVSRSDLREVLTRWTREREYDAFCLNDTGIHDASPLDVHATVHEFLNHYFPLRSRFEDAAEGPLTW